MKLQRTNDPNSKPFDAPADVAKAMIAAGLCIEYTERTYNVPPNLTQVEWSLANENFPLLRAYCPVCKHGVVMDKKIVSFRHCRTRVDDPTQDLAVAFRRLVTAIKPAKQKRPTSVNDRALAHWLA